MGSRARDKVNGFMDSMAKVLSPAKKSQGHTVSSESRHYGNHTQADQQIVLDEVEHFSVTPEQTNPTETTNHRGNAAKKGKHKSKAKPVFCIPNCPHNGEYNAAMIQCHLCQIWMHYYCGDVLNSELENIVVWTCKNCRLLPLTVNQMMTKMNQLHEKMDKLLAENVKLREENVKLSNQIMERQSAVPVNELTKESVLMGSSIVKSILDQFTLESTKVYGKSGGRIADIISELEKRGSKEKYQSATFVIGGNNCESPKEVGEIVNDFRTLIDTAKSKVNMSHCQACCPGKVGRSYKTKSMRSIPNFQIYVTKNHVNMLTMTVLSNCLMVPEMTHSIIMMASILIKLAK